MESLQSLVPLVSLLLLILLPNLQFTTSNKTASFSLKLIHCYSPASPFYPGAMPLQERQERYLKTSQSRASSWKIITMHNTTAQPNMMRPVVGNEGLMYEVELEIGSPGNIYYLILDTGSGLTWWQFQPCKECFRQKYEIYDPKNSKTFEEVPCIHPLCRYFNCTNQQRLYTIDYFYKAFTEGYLAMESFHIKDEKGTYTHIDEVPFGCSNVNRGFKGRVGFKMAGIIGLDRSPYSFITHMGSFIMSRFSYCLINPLVQDILKSYPTFGLDMGYLGGPVQKTPFVKVPNSYAYGLNLLDISVNFKRLNYPPGSFQFRPDGSGGFIIDSRATISYIDDEAYPRLEDELVRYFSAFKQLVRGQTWPPPTKIYCTTTMGYPLFPTLTLHFEGADLKIEPENVVLTIPDDKFFTVAIAPGRSSILGSFQQHNTRFVYDIDSNVLGFVPDDCSKDEA